MKRSKEPSQARRLLLAFLAGMAFGYYLDPEHGHGRRVRASARIGAGLRHLSRRTGRTVRYAAGRTEGIALKVIPQKAEPPADDNTLVDRVRSEIFEHPGLPKGDLNFEAIKGVVTVHGEVADGEHIDAIEKAIRKVPGVLGVRNLLHLPGTPAPNKAAVLRAG
jgi:hypothetical protein